MLGGIFIEIMTLMNHDMSSMLNRAGLSQCQHIIEEYEVHTTS
jgi:hypothetical protein